MIDFTMALAQFELFILILMRIASFVFVAPFFNTANTPRKVKVGFSFLLSILIFSMESDMAVVYDSSIDYALLVIKEVVVGLILGLMTSLCVQIIMFSGKIIDIDIGISMAQIMDPTTRMQVGIMGNFYYYMLLLMLIVSGMYRYLVSAIVATYNVIPVGQLKFGQSLYKVIVDFMADYFIIGFRIALPVFATTLLLNCVLAIIARVAPQMNMFVVGMQLKIFAGIFVILFTISMLPSVSTYIQNEIEVILNSLVKGMS